jgi:RNA polymerase sigma factor for flagellar operon FliA
VDRGALVEQHIDLVRSIAGKLVRRVSTSVELEDLIAFGREGLVRAAERYDPERGVAFSTFAYYRVRGAIFDGLRRMGPRPLAPRQLFEEHADAYLEQLGGEPAPPTAAAAADRLAGAISDLAVAWAIRADAEEASCDHSIPDPETVAERKEQLSVVQKGMARLPEPERQLLELMYFEGEGVVAAGERLGLSKGWASRLHARALARLKQEIVGAEAERAPGPAAIRV